MFKNRYKNLRYGHERPEVTLALSRKLVGGVAKEREINWVGIKVMNMGTSLYHVQKPITNIYIFVHISW